MRGRNLMSGIMPVRLGSLTRLCSLSRVCPHAELLGRALSSDGQWQEFESWASKVPNSINKYPYYWLALGDWARFKQQYTQAARCYWEATQADADPLKHGQN